VVERRSNVETIIAHHLASAERGDVDSMMTDYAAGGAQGALQVQKRIFRGNVGYLLWVQHAGTPDEVRGSA
jgi:hypothetical protein